MKKILLSVLVVGVVGVMTWSNVSQREVSTESPRAISEPDQQMTSPVFGQNDNTKISSKISSMESESVIPEQAAGAVDDVVHEFVHNPVVPVEKTYIQLTLVEKTQLTNKRDQAAEEIQQAMLEYDNYLDDPIKMAEIQASIQGDRDSYKQAMIKLGKDVIKE